MSERHIIKIAVELRSAKLLVRFPCKLTFQLKTDSAQTQSRNAFELKKGECFINETLEAEAELNYDPLNGQYEDKKVRIFVQMASANGVIPAGNVTFNPCNKEPLEKVEYTLPLEKCPDRSAQINFLQSFTLLRKTAPEVIYQSQVANRQTSKLTKMDLKYSSASNLAVQRPLPRKSPRDKSNNSRTRLGVNYREVSPQARVKTSQAANYPSFRQQDQYEEYGESQVVHEEDIGYQKYTSRYMEPSQKAHYVKEIAKLKGEIKSLQADQRWDQLIRVKEENEYLTSDLQKAKERIRMNERREREMGIQLKEMKQDGERTKNKYLQSESLKNEGEVVIAEKDQSIKQLQNQIKRLEQKMQDLNTQLNNQQKRVEFKETSYQEQLRKMNEKYTQSEAERQKITFDYNTLLAKLEETEKKHQGAAKEKERNYAEEKNRLNKKIDSLTQTVEKLKEEQADRETQLNQNILMVKSLTKRETEREEKLGSVESELELSKMQLKKELDQRKLYEQEITAYKLVEEERNQLRKKNNELTVELAKTNERLERTISELGLLDSKARDLEGTLGERTKERDSLNAKSNSLKKEVEALTKEQDRLTRENQNLSAQSFNAGQKINDLKSNLETHKNQSEEMKMFYEEQLAYIAKSKEYSDSEVEEHKWKIDKYEQQCNQINFKLKAANSEILTLNETILMSNERAKRAEEESKQLNSTVDFLKKEILDWEQKERAFNEQVKDKNDKIYELTKKIQNNEGQFFILQEKMKQLESNSEEKKSSDEKSLRERQRQLSQKSEELTTFQLELMSLKEQFASSSQEVTIRGNQINYLKESLQSLKQDLTVKEVKLEETKEELKLSHQLNQSLSKEVENLTKLVQEEKKSGSKLKKEWEDYRSDTTKALHQLLDEISKDDEGAALTKQNLLTFPDQTLSAMQAEAFKKRNSILAKYQLKLLELNEEKVILQGELAKHQKIAVEKEEEYQTLLKVQKEKMKQLTAQSEFEHEQLSKKIEELEENKLELSGEIEKLTNEIKKKEEHIDEQKEEIRITLGEVESLMAEVKLAEEKIMGLKSNEIKWKASNESKISQISGQNDAVIERYRLKISELEKKLQAEERSSKEKEESIKKQEVKISELNYEKQKSQIRALELNEKVILSGEQKKQLEKRVKQLEKEIKQTSQQLTTAKEALLNEKAKFQQVQSKLAEAHSGLTESQVDAEKLRAELEAAKHSIIDLEENLKDKGEKVKSIGEKSSLEVKQLKEKIIGLNSSVELKEFQVGQLQGQVTTLKQNLKEAKEELSKKKAEVISLADKIQQKTNQEMYNSQNIDILKSEKEFLEEQNERLKERVAELQEDITEAKVLIETAEMKEKEYFKLKEDYETLKLERDRASNELRTSLVNQKVSNITASRVGGSNELKRIRELEQLLEAKHVDVAIERKKLINEFEREKRAIINQNAELSEEVANLQGQFDFQRAQLSKEIQSLDLEVNLLTKELNDKTEALAAQEQLLEAIKTQQNAEQIEECLANIKSIFERTQGARDERSLPVQSVPVSEEQAGIDHD